MGSFGSYGVVAATAEGADTISKIAEEIHVRGFSTAPDVLTPSQVHDLCCSLDSVYSKQCDEVGGARILEDIQDVDIVRCPLAYDDSFLALAGHPLIIDVARKLLGPNIVLLMQNGIINRPDRLQAQTRWHRDLNYQHWVSSTPLAISALVCLEDFNEQTGATNFLPASHKFEEFPSKELVTKLEAGVNAPSGSILFFDAMAFHRAGINQSDRIRRAVNHVIGLPILAQQIDIPSMLGGKSPSESWFSDYLGFRWNPAESVRGWRLKKHDQVTAAGIRRGAQSCIEP